MMFKGKYRNLLGSLVGVKMALRIQRGVVQEWRNVEDNGLGRGL